MRTAARTLTLQMRRRREETMTRIPILQLTGGPRQRGRSRGEALRPLIREQIERNAYEAALSTPATNWDGLVEGFVSGTGHVGAAEKWAPDCLEEIRGIAEGAGIDFEQALVLSCLDELWRYTEALQGKSTHACTSLGCFRAGDQPALMGQNLDTSLLSRGLEVLLDIEEAGGHRSFVVTYPGSLGVMTLNDAPLGVCVNTIHLKCARDGLPLQFVIRGINARRTLDAAIAFVRSVRIGAAQNLMIGDADRVVDLECSANKVVQYTPFEGAQCVYHTNHHLANDDLIPGYPTITANSLERLRYLEFRLGRGAPPVSVQNVKGILSSHLSPICYHGGYTATAVNTWVSVVYSLSSPPELHLAVGNPCTSGYDRFTFG